MNIETKEIFMENLKLYEVDASILDKYYGDIFGFEADDEFVDTKVDDYLVSKLKNHVNFTNLIDNKENHISGIKYVLIDNTQQKGNRLIGYFGFSPTIIGEKIVEQHDKKRLKSIEDEKNVSKFIKHTGAIGLDFFALHSHYRGVSCINPNTKQEYKLSQILIDICLNEINKVATKLNTNTIILYSTAIAIKLYIRAGFLPCYNVFREEMLEIEECKNDMSIRGVLLSKELIKYCNVWENKYTLTLTPSEIDSFPMYKIIK
ncbi:MAG: hypothetical protein ATN35_09865 [Epulopiscium sp. Nele67-Bin004]|nr:MAG: hypothetical protein ATN35_09865 [Epulopiscium sp. Nele67-Bin004]